MTNNIRFSSIRPLLLVSGLILLLLLSPCKVRNFIQAELGIPQTEVTNKSQSTLSQASCEIFETQTAHQTASESPIQLPDGNAEEWTFQFVGNSKKKEVLPNPISAQRAPNIPFYILYQNLLVYS